MADSRDSYSEYAGKPGLIQTAEDGHVELAVKEKAMIGRIWGRDGNQPADEIQINAGLDRATGEPWEDAAHRAQAIDRANKLKKLNGRGMDQA